MDDEHNSDHQIGSNVHIVPFRSTFYEKLMESAGNGPGAGTGLAQEIHGECICWVSPDWAKRSGPLVTTQKIPDNDYRRRQNPLLDLDSISTPCLKWSCYHANSPWDERDQHSEGMICRSELGKSEQQPVWVHHIHSMEWSECALISQYRFWKYLYI